MVKTAQVQAILLTYLLIMLEHFSTLNSLKKIEVLVFIIINMPKRCLPIHWKQLVNNIHIV